MPDATRLETPMQFPLATRCPECHTAFRITEAQYQHAKGMVRCGECFNVFDASRHITSIPQSGTLRYRQANSVSDQAGWFEQSYQEKAHQNRTDGVIGIESVDESWALALLAELENGIKNTLTPQRQEYPLASQTSQSSSFQALVGANVPAFINSGVSSLAEVDDTHLVSSLMPKSVKLGYQEKGFHVANDTSKLPRSQASRSFLKGKENHPKATTAPKVKKVGWGASGSSLGRRSFPWLTINGLLIVAVLSAFIWQQWPSLVHTPQLSGLVHWICRHSSCNLPIRKDWSKLNLSLKVRKHPELSSSLQANALLSNQADFSQPFPWLILEFSDINGRELGRYRFAPKDYLKGEMLSQRQLPSNQSVQIVLNLPDPGKEAVNYHAYVDLTADALP